MPTFTSDHLRQIAASIFEAAGVAPAEANVVAESLVESNLAGHDSHGVLRIPLWANAGIGVQPDFDVLEKLCLAQAKV